MSGDLKTALNDVLKRAGIAASDLEVLSCPGGDAPCEIQFRDAGQSHRQSFAKATDFYAWANQWLPAHLSLAKSKGINSLKIFQPLKNDWLAVDWNDQPGAEALLWKDGSDWNLFAGAAQSVGEKAIVNEVLSRAAGLLDAKEAVAGLAALQADPAAWLPLAERLAGRSWQDAGLKAGAAEFQQFSYPFQIESAESNPGLVSPLDKVKIRGDASRSVPWSDPYLQIEWIAFLRDAGAELVSTEAGKRNVYYFNYHGLPLMQVTLGEDGKDYQFFTPMGDVAAKISVKRNLRPWVQVNRLDTDHQFEIQIGRRKLAVELHRPKGWDAANERAYLLAVAENLADIPPAFLNPLLSGEAKEAPIRLRFSDAADAIELGLLAKRHKEISGGTYSPGINRVWIGIGDKPPGDGILFHEIGGHAWSDFQVSQDDALYLTDRGQSALRVYYAWKLRQLFSPAELENYIRLSSEYARYRQDPDRDPALDAGWLKQLEPYRGKVTANFVTVYAAEGPDGITPQARVAEENFAECMQVFLEALNVRNPWLASRRQEPMLQLIGLAYLFDTYAPSQIGTLARGDVFSEKGFREVLGIALEDSLPLFTLAEETAPLPEEPYWLAPGMFGIATQRNKSGTSLLAKVGIRPLWQHQAWRVGGELDFSKGIGSDAAPHWAIDLGASAGLSKEVAGLKFFLEPRLGLRLEKNSNLNFDPWYGGRAGLSLFNERFSIFLEQKNDLSWNSKWSERGIGAAVSLHNLF